MLRLATSFTSEEQHISGKNISVVYMEAAGHTETADLTTGSLGERLEWLWSEFKLPINQETESLS